MSSSRLVDFSRPCPKNGYYDVFLSFRGGDTRFGFTYNLYRLLKENKVYTFMDVNLTGQNVDHLFEMIEKSRMAVVIYSEGFASAPWCLKELEKILQRREDKKMLIIPIFYKVNVDELKHLTGETAKHLDKHQHNQSVVEKWKAAVTSLGYVSGMSYKNNKYEYDFIMEVIAKIKENLATCDESLEFRGIIKPNSNNVQTRHNIIDLPIVHVQEECIKEFPGVYSVDVHPTKPWFLLGLRAATVCIWNYETRAVEKSFKVNQVYFEVKYVKFVPKKHWIVAVGSHDKFVHVLDYNTSKVLKEFKAHEDIILCVAVHHILPYVLTASNDKLIKLWNWEDDWACLQTFEGHSSSVEHLTFNPKDATSFASVSRDFTFKIWSLDSKVAKFSSNKNACGSNCVEYFVGTGDRLYLFLKGFISLSYASIWDCESKTFVQNLEGGCGEIKTILVHPELPVILTGSSWDFVTIWDKNTYQLLLEWKCDLRTIYSFRFIKATGEVVIACEDGMVVIKIVYSGTQSA